MKAAGNNWEYCIKDHEKFTNDAQYAAGWIASEIEGNTSKSKPRLSVPGEAVGAGYSGYRINDETNKAKLHPHDIAKDVLKDVGTTELETLGK
jgi:hypothetical protein